MHTSTVPEGDTPFSNEEIITNAVETLTGDKARWVIWQYLENEEGGKPVKMPYGREGNPAKVSDPTTWLPYEDAQRICGEYDLEGVGIMFDGSFLGVDLDNCVEDREIVDPVVAAFVAIADTYTEISPSGTGLHLLFNLAGPYKAKKNRHGNYEVYTHDRYFTFTGNLFNQNLVRTVTPEEVEHLLEAIGYPWHPVKSAVDNVVFGNATNLDQEIAKEKMFNSKHGAEIEALYNGDTSAYGGDTSKAEAALVKHAAYWLGSDREAVREFWLQSPLAQREKTQERPDYQNRTLDFALQDSSGLPAPELNTSLTDSSNGAQSDSKTKMSLRQRFEAAEVDLVDLLKMDIKVEWDVEQLITSGSLNMIASPPHQGKTFMALHISTCMAFGLPVFGKFKVEKQKNVMIINEEDVLAELKGRLEEMVPDEVMRDRIKLYASTGDKVSDEWSEVVLERAKINNTGLIILDSFGALSLANENEAQSVYEVMDCFRRFVREGITVIFIHHDRKSSTQGSDTGAQLDRARGSSAIGAAVHGYLSIQELSYEEFVVTQVKLKANVRKVKPFVVQKNRELQSDATFRNQFVYVGDYNPDATAAQGVEERLVKLCQEHGADFLFTRKTLVDYKLAFSAGDKTLRNALSWMENKGLLKSSKYSELTDKQQSLVKGEVQKANTLVYWPTEVLLKDVDAKGADDLDIPF